MKKVILILLAAVAFSCGDGSSRSSESDTHIEENDAIESDTMQMEGDTTATPGMDRQGGVDTTSNKNNENTP